MLALYSSSRFMPNAGEQMPSDMAPGLIGVLFLSFFFFFFFLNKQAWTGRESLYIRLVSCISQSRFYNI